MMCASWPAPLRRTGIVQVQSRSDESKMRKRLREVADLPLCSRIVLFREQADIIAKRQQAFEQGARFRVAVLQRVVVGKPETAGKEDTFSRRETVDACLGSVPQHEAIDHELPLDRRDGAAHTWIVRRQEAHERHQQQARIELAPAEALGEGVAALVESLLANRRVHAIANLSPTLQRSLQF